MKYELLENLSKSPLVYFLNTEDVQNVAKEKLGREVTHGEIKKLIDSISENINWEEAISYAIDQNL